LNNSLLTGRANGATGLALTMGLRCELPYQAQRRLYHRGDPLHLSRTMTALTPHLPEGEGNYGADTLSVFCTF
jgi:hypothetical protein